jgi:Carboxypeptidase regulatory-like domain
MRFYTATGLVAVHLFVFGCADATSPVEPTPPPAVPPALQEFRLSGAVSDAAWRPLKGSRVEVIDGPRAGSVATTDEAGRFSMPGTFTGNVTVTASKDGYVPETRPVLAQGYPSPAGNAGGSWEIAFSLGPLGPSASIAGVYTLTLTADRACTNLPDTARTRSYVATIHPGAKSTDFLARLSDARFLSTYNQFAIGIAGDFAGIGNADIVEQLPESTFLVVGGKAAGSFGPSGITAPFEGYFLYCPTEPRWTSGEYWECQASVQCDSRNHQLTLVRR